MNIKKIFLLSLFSSGSAMALENPYVSMNIGYGFANKPSATTAALNNTPMIATKRNVNNMMAYGIGLGYKLTPCIRTELAFDYRPRVKFKADDNVPETGVGNLNNSTLMLNGYYEIKLFDPFKGYVMAGLGWSRNQTSYIKWPVVNQNEFGKTVNNFAWTVGLGVSSELTSHITVDFGYKCLSLGRFQNTGHYNDGTAGAPTKFKSLYNHAITIGLRYQF